MLTVMPRVNIFCMFYDGSKISCLHRIFTELVLTDEDSALNVGNIDLLKQRRELSKKRKLCLVQTVNIF